MQISRHFGLRRRVGKDFARRPLHVRAQGVSEIGVVGKVGVVSRLHEAGDEARAKVFAVSLPGVDFEHPGMTAMRLRVARWTSESLGPVVGQVLDVLGVHAVRERMVEPRVLETALVMRGGKRAKRRVPAGEFVNRRTGHADSFSMPADEDPPDDHRKSR